VSALKSYCRAKGLCFKCGEKWSPQHKCPPTVSLNAMEQLWQCVIDRDENGTDIFRPYSRLNSFRGVQICPYSSLNIQHPIPYPYSNT
jgi:hypothetical protein